VSWDNDKRKIDLRSKPFEQLRQFTQSIERHYRRILACELATAVFIGHPDGHEYMGLIWKLDDVIIFPVITLLSPDFDILAVQRMPEIKDFYRSRITGSM
jgi:hypothetical protein